LSAASDLAPYHLALEVRELLGGEVNTIAQFGEARYSAEAPSARPSQTQAGSTEEPDRADGATDAAALATGLMCGKWVGYPTAAANFLSATGPTGAGTDTTTYVATPNC